MRSSEKNVAPRAAKAASAQQAGGHAPALGARAGFALCVLAGAVALLIAAHFLSEQALSSAHQTAQGTIAFARQSVKRHEENISDSRTKSVAALWEKLEELDDRYDVASAKDRTQVEEHLSRLGIDCVILLDAGGHVAGTVGDEAAASALKDTLEENDALLAVAAYPQKSYLSSTTAGSETYDYAACATSSLVGGVLVGVRHVEKTDVNGGQNMFNSMFDNYVLAMDGSVAVLDEEQVLASNDPEVAGKAREDFDALLSLSEDHSGEELADGTYEGVDCYGLKTTTNGYDLYVWFPAGSVMAHRNMMLAASAALYIVALLVVAIAHSRVQNSRLRREHEYLESLERANAAKTDFLRRMSHDVRTPINGIRGMLAIGDHYADDLGKQAECRAKMWEASSFLLDLVNSALDMNKLESGEMHFDNKPFDLQKAFQSVTDVLEVQAENAGIDFTSEICAEHTRVVGSSLHVRQVLQNIGSNAIKYNRAGGSVRIMCRELEAADGRARFLFACVDTGVGMSSEFQKHAFDAFAQEDTSSRATYRGTGLGLAIAKEIVDQMGGTIDLTSTKGQGTRFAIELSFDLDEQASDEGRASEAGAGRGQAPLKGMRVLLAEDNELNSEIALFMLSQEGIVADTARDGRETVEMFKRSPAGYYDMILMDEMMPVMSGTEAARAIRLLERSDAHSVPIIAVTANAFSDDRALSAAAGMNDHVSKPLDAENLIAAIRRNRL